MISQPFGYITLSTTSLPAQGLRCCVCGSVAEAVIYDYSEVEFNVLIEPHSPKPLCHEHKRPAKIFFLDGHVENVSWIKHQMYSDQFHSSFELAQEDR